MKPSFTLAERHQILEPGDPSKAGIIAVMSGGTRVGVDAVRRAGPVFIITPVKGV